MAFFCALWLIRSKNFFSIVKVAVHSSSFISGYKVNAEGHTCILRLMAVVTSLWNTNSSSSKSHAQWCRINLFVSFMHRIVICVHSVYRKCSQRAFQRFRQLYFLHLLKSWSLQIPQSLKVDKSRFKVAIECQRVWTEVLEDERSDTSKHSVDEKVKIYLKWQISSCFLCHFLRIHRTNRRFPGNRENKVSQSISGVIKCWCFFFFSTNQSVVSQVAGTLCQCGEWKRHTMCTQRDCNLCDTRSSPMHE